MKKRISNLDGLRFLAALVVLLCHVEAMKTDLHMKAFTNRFFIISAQYAVSFFFVLSGFLITYLLLLEKKQENRVDLAAFYTKRILRIWPLYYIVLILVYFVLPNSGLTEGIAGVQAFNKWQFTEYVFFLPNTAELLHGPKYAFEQTWSLGVEEFFYLFFPLLLYFTSIKKLKPILYFLTILFLIAGTIVIIPSNYFPLPRKIADTIFYYLIRYRIYCFLIGGLAAWYLLFPSGKKVENWLNKKWVLPVLLMLLFICTIFGITFSFLSHPFYSILFAILLFSLVKSGKELWIFNNRAAVYLGKISYGIYMYHPIAILIVLQSLKHRYDGSISYSVLLQFFCILLTILLAAISYETIEKLLISARRKMIRE